MKPSRSLALAAALAGCAVAYGVHLTRTNEAPETNAVSPVKLKSRALARARQSSGTLSEQISERRERRSSDPIAAAESRQASAAPTFHAGRVLSESQWRDNAVRVEMEANHELRRLTALLDLAPYQQEKIFSTLAQSSPYWGPGMAVGGGDFSSAASKQTQPSGNNKSRTHSSDLAPGGTTSGNLASRSTADIAAYIDSSQADILVNDAKDREEWWGEILKQLLPEVPSAATATDASSSTEPPAETKEFDGGDSLITE